MSNSISPNVGYGLTNALQQLTPLPIISVRNPTVYDKAEIGTLWVNKLTNNYYILTSVTNNQAFWEGQNATPATSSAVEVGGDSTQTLNAATGVVTVTGLTTAQNANAVITINNNLITTTSGLQVSVASLNASGNGAVMSINGVEQSAGQIVVTIENIAAGALGAGDNVLVTFQVFN